ncbi:hypothetical protein ACSZNX_20755 [Aeromonas veronii]|uniref:hypothetical protein n=1 Tax=Aeromonas veronii TaxID=654 RepID=UPI003EC62AE8
MENIKFCAEQTHSSESQEATANYSDWMVAPACDEANNQVSCADSVFDYADLLKRQDVDDHSTLKKDVEKAKGLSCHVGIDVEYYFDAILGRNVLLTCQYCLKIGDQELNGIVYIKSDKAKDRPRFQQFIGQILHNAKQKGVIEEYPAIVYIYGHFLRADITHFSDFWAKYKTVVSGIRRTISSLNGAYAVDIDDIGARRTGSGLMKLRDKFRKEIECKVKFVDTLPLTPSSAGLDIVGDLIGIPKLVLPEGYSKSDMKRFMLEQPDLFRDYALRDAKIAVVYGLKMQGFAEGLGLKSLPATIGSIAVNIFILSLDKLGLDLNSAIGVEEITEEIWDERRGKPRTIKRNQATAARLIFEELARLCYAGGRNETYMFGPTVYCVFHDVDIVGAYLTALLGLRVPDYENARLERDPDAYRGDVMGFARVRFSFPAGTSYPCLPVRSRAGLIFPLRGVGYCGAAEIEAALNMGCDIEILQGCIVPWVKGSPRIFSAFAEQVRANRAKYPKGSFEEQLWKECGNSLYGKTGQGLKNKSTFDIPTGLSKAIPASAITNPYFAAYVTSFVRAVLAELLNNISHHYGLISVTTDGFITTADLSEIPLDGPVSSRFHSLCHSSEMLIEKHRVQQLIAMKTRGQVTSVACDGYPEILAKAGVKPPVPRPEHNSYMLDLFLQREPDQRTDASHLISTSEQWRTESDLVMLQKTRRLNLEFDWKRRLVNPRMTGVAGVEHISCDSEPWETIEQCEHARALFDGWRLQGNCLKTMADWASWEDYYESALALQGSKMRVCADGSLGIFTRILTRSLVQKAWYGHTMSYSEISALLTSVGLPVTVDTCKNSKRAKLYEHVVPVTGEVLRVLGLLLRQLPRYPLEPLFKPGRVDEVKRRLAEMGVTHG